MRKHLDVLEIPEDVTRVTLKYVNAKFRKLAKILHPDKASDKTTAAFQKVLRSCEILRDYLKRNDNEDNRKTDAVHEDDFQFFEDNFDKFNFPFENNGSFTVIIEDYLADTWQDCMEKILGEPKVRINDKGTECDRLWKQMYGDIELTIHLYNKPKNKKPSKLMIQGGRQSMICSYVFDELPKIYKLG